MRRRSEEVKEGNLNSLWVKKMSIRPLIDGWDKGDEKTVDP